MNAKEALNIILEYEVPFNKTVKRINKEIQDDIDRSAKLVEVQVAQTFDEQIRGGIEKDLESQKLSYDQHKEAMVSARKKFIEEEVAEFKVDAKEQFDMVPMQLLMYTNLLMDNLGGENKISNKKLCKLLGKVTDEKWTYKLVERLSKRYPNENGYDTLDYHLIFENELVYFDATPDGVNFGADMDADQYESNLLENVDWLKYFLVSKEVFTSKELYLQDINLEFPKIVEDAILNFMQNMPLVEKDDETQNS